MQLKCIGGECDGKVIEVDNALRIGDLVRIPKRIKLTTVDYNNANPIPTIVETPIVYYKIEAIHSLDGTIKFLIPTDWNNWQAVIYVFDKKGISEYSDKQLMDELRNRNKRA